MCMPYKPLGMSDRSHNRIFWCSDFEMTSFPEEGNCSSSKDVPMMNSSVRIGISAVSTNITNMGWGGGGGGRRTSY